MPIVKSGYRPGLLMRNPHINTLYASKFRTVPDIAYTRERFELPDGDFVDLDWHRTGSDRLAIILHGLGGHSRRSYVRAMIHALDGWDCCAMNLRGSSGEPNRLPCTYHSGRTDDLHAVATAIAARGTYRTMLLVGFSLGGNITVKYLSEQGRNHPFSAGIAVSAPVHLPGSAARIQQSRYYMEYMLSKLRPYITAKAAQFPGLINIEGLESIRTFTEYDNRFTAPLNGFASASEYWERASALRYIDGLVVPCLLVNAEDDPILSPECIPVAVAATHPHLHLDAERHGGHVGFVSPGAYYHETAALRFLDELKL